MSSDKRGGQLTIGVKASPAPQSEEDAGRHAEQYVKYRKRVEAIDREERDAIAKIRKEAAKKRKRFVRERDKHLAQAQAWAEANRGDRKTIKLSNGRVFKWRKPSNPKLIFDEGRIKTIVRILMRLPNWQNYLRIELRRNNVKADLEELGKNSGLRHYVKVDDSERFYVG